MIVNVLTNKIGAIKDQWFHTIELERLHRICNHIAEHQKHCQSCLEMKKDFLVRARYLSRRDDYNKLLEHYGIEFWTKFYENEHPVCILDHSLLEHAPYRAYKDQKNLEDCMLLPSNSSLAR